MINTREVVDTTDARKACRAFDGMPDICSIPASRTESIGDQHSGIPRVSAEGAGLHAIGVCVVGHVLEYDRLLRITVGQIIRYHDLLTDSKHPVRSIPRAVNEALIAGATVQQDGYAQAHSIRLYGYGAGLGRQPPEDQGLCWRCGNSSQLRLKVRILPTKRFGDDDCDPCCWSLHRELIESILPIAGVLIHHSDFVEPIAQQIVQLSGSHSIIG